jgi:uncharacterized LabA/DUF88 family protein
MSHHYLFIDGEYLDQAYSKDLMQPFFGVPGDLEVAAVIASLNAYRTYYYNAIDERPRGPETPEQLQLRVNEAKERFARIDGISHCHVRLGTVAGERTRKRRQKQVDVQLAVDALLHAFNKNILTATLIAGDLDFKPLVQALVSLGIRTKVIYEKRSSQPAFYRAADETEQITLHRAWEWSTDAFRNAHPLPTVSYSLDTAYPGGIHYRIGQWQGQEIRTVVLSQSREFSIVTRGDGARRAGVHVTSENLDLLDRYWTYEFGSPVWSNVGENPLK